MTVPAFDLDDITPQDVPDDDKDFSIPDANASRDDRRNWLSYLNKRKKEDEKPTRGRPRARARKRASTPKKGVFVEPLMQMYGALGVFVTMRGDEHCGTAILEAGEKCAETLDELAYQNESVRRVLDALTTGSAMGAVLMAHAPIIIAVASHHGASRVPFVPKVVQDEVPNES